ncbi:MAG: methyl-accepting chemotaxis protein, partial [Clostridia bacterium]|nr:methyl-accepting chemotaxis protein [Deltaproteobacteria bacterium]
MGSGIRLGLRERLIFVLLATLLGSGLVVAMGARMLMRKPIVRELTGRTDIINQALDASADIAGAVTGGDATGAQLFLDKLIQAEPELVYVMVFTGDADNPLDVAWAARMPLVEGFDLRQTTSRHAFLKHAFKSTDADNARIIHRAVNLKTVMVDAPSNAAPSFDALMAGSGSAMIGMTPDVQLQRYTWAIATACLVAGGIIMLILWMFFQRLSVRVGALKTYAAQIAEGDLTGNIVDDSTDEFGDLAHALTAITLGLGRTIAQVRTSSIEMDSVSSRVRDASEKIASDAGTQAKSVRQTGAAMNNMSRASQTFETQMSDVTRAAEVSSQRLRDISGAVDRITSTVHQVAGAVEQTRQHLEDNVARLSEVDRAVDRLNSAAEGTAAATTQITNSIGMVERNSDEALQMSRDTSSKAESGVKAVKETLDGIVRIRTFTNETVSSVRFLSQKVESI